MKTKGQKINKLAEVCNFAETLTGVAVTLAIGSEVLRIVQKNYKLAQIKKSIRIYQARGNYKKVIEGFLRYILVWGFE